MAPTKKSIYRTDGAQHFQLVHRSVRDPLAYDPDASQQVFKPIGRANDAQKPGYTLADLEQSLDKTRIRENEGEAATYGITYDDSAYDYMQHLKPVGMGGGEIESVLLAAPSGGSAMPRGHKGVQGKNKGKTPEDMFAMPDEVLASQHEMTWHEAAAAKEAIPPELQGLQPDMDPHLRQVLEALDDDAFVEDAGDEDDFGELLAGGELDYDEEAPEFEFAEWGLAEDGHAAKPPPAGADDDSDAGTENGEPQEETWMDRFKAFKEGGGKPQRAVSNGGWESDDGDGANRSEAADTVGEMLVNADMVVLGGKRRHGKRGPSDATGMSMSSASMYRSDGLRNLDDRFDVIERQYELDDDDEYIGDYDDDDVSIAPSYVSTASTALMSHAGDVPEVTREDFDAIMDDFLDNYEVAGGRMREALGGTGLSGADKLKILRSALEDGDEGPTKDENRQRILELERLNRGYVREKKDLMPMGKVNSKAEPKWDVESIISTYTNTENHPGTIRVRSSADAKKRAEARARAAEDRAAAEAAAALDAGQDDSGSDTEREEPRVTVARPKGESTEERRSRKAAIKAERAGRRAEKKAHTETFNDERKRQLNAGKKAVAGGRAADLSVGAGRPGVISL